MVIYLTIVKFCPQFPAETDSFLRLFETDFLSLLPLANKTITFSQSVS
jgi:hypothetical protein